jgi:hypothetical protein
MQEFNDYKLLRETVSLEDDDDFAGDQTVPSFSLAELTRPRSQPGASAVRIKIEIVLEWLDDREPPEVLSGDRGSYDLQAIRVTTRRGNATDGNIIVDSTTLRGQIAHRPVVLDDILVGDAFTVRLTNMARDGAEKARLLYREII